MITLALYQEKLPVFANIRYNLRRFNMSSINIHHTAAQTRDGKLSFGTKAAYAIGDLGNAVGPGTVIPFWYTFYLTDIARLDLGLVSLFWLPQVGD